MSILEIKLIINWTYFYSDIFDQTKFLSRVGITVFNEEKNRFWFVLNDRCNNSIIFVLFRLKTGDVLFVTPKAGSRFITADEEDHAGNGHMSTSGSSASLASLNSVKSSNNTVAASVNIEVRATSHFTIFLQMVDIFL